MKTNYQKKLEETLQLISCSGQKPRLLLHSCCGPCSSYVLEYLSEYFEITVLYYNPNIYPESEYEERAYFQGKLLSDMMFSNSVRLIVPDQQPSDFDKAVAGLENEPEGGKRCYQCFALRLNETARYAKEHGFDCFTTTLSVSPHKDAEALNEIGAGLEKKYGVKFLAADFKKKNGYKRSIELSEQCGLYRQKYCGCRYSMNDARSNRDSG